MGQDREDGVSKVSLVKVGSIDSAVNRAVRLACDLDALVPSGAKVFVKPNMLAGLDPETGATTNPRVLEALIRLLQTRTHDITLVESDFKVPLVRGAPMPMERDLDRVYEMPQYDGVRALGVKFLNLSRGSRRIYGDIAGMFIGTLRFPVVLENVDVLINVPVMKTHYMTTVTLGLKNLYGLIPRGHVRARLHTMIAEVLCDLAARFKPRLTLIDGTIGMEGAYGPCFGAPAYSRVLVASTDLVAADSVGCRVMGFQPESMTGQNPIALAETRGIGNAALGRIEVVGEKIDRVRRKYDMDKQLPLELVRGIRELGTFTESEIAESFAGREDLVRRYIESMLRYGPVVRERGMLRYDENLYRSAFICKVCGDCPEWSTL